MISSDSPEDTHDRYLHRYAGEWHPLDDEDAHFDEIEESVVVRHLSRVAVRDEIEQNRNERDHSFGTNKIHDS
jgi:hypothetical protein